MLDVLEGAKGKSSSGSGGATESPNTLRSTSVISLVEALGEGEIEGLVDGAKSIFFDGTPLMSADGTLNRKGVEWEFRSGLPDQDYLHTNTRAGTPYQVGAEVKISTGRVIRTITDTNAALVQVIVQIPALAKTNTETGETGGADVNYVIERRAYGGQWEVVANVSIANQKCISPYYRVSSVPRPPGDQVWDIAVRRLTPDSEVVTLQNGTIFDSYITIVRGKYSYPDTALIALKIDSQQFGSSLGERLYHVRGLKIQVPSNYDPIARTYSGIWDGSFVTRWSNNPAWVFWDLLTNNRYGLGEFVEPTFADKWFLYDVARYCDQMVPSGFKNAAGADIYEPRFVFNGVINTREEAYKVLQNITNQFRGMAYWAMDRVFVSCDMPADPVASFSPANVIDGRFKYSGTAVKARHSVAFCKWNDPDNYFKPATEVVQDDDQLSRFGWRQVDLQLVGCTSRGQAHRFGKWVLDTEKSETETVQFQISWDNYILEGNGVLKPGDIALVSNPRKNGGFRAHGRFADVGATLKLDMPFEVEPGVDYTIGALTATGKFESHKIASFGDDNATVTLLTPFSVPPVRGGEYVIQGTNMAARRYRVISVSEAEKNKFTVTALFNDPTKYARIEQGVTLDPVPYQRPRNVIKDVTNVTAIESRFFQSGVSHSRVTVSWTGPNDFLIRDYLITADSPRGFQNLGSTPMPTIDVTDAAPGLWKFYISARSVSGAVSVPVTFEFNVEGWEAVDGPIPNNLRTSDGGNTFAGRSVTLLWDNVFPPDSVLYAVENVVRVYDASGHLLRTEIVKQPNYTYDYEKNVNDGGPRRTVRIDVTAKSITGRESERASISVSNPVPAKVEPKVKADVGSVEVSWTGADNDYAGALVWASLSLDFTPTLQNALYDGPDTSTTLWLDGGKFYFWVALYDAFGKVGLNISDPVSLQVNSLTSTLAQVVPDLVAATGQVTSEQLASTAEDLADQIAGLLGQIIADRDDNDQFHKRAHQELSVKTDRLSAVVAEETSARIEADFAEATRRQILEATINTNIIAAIAQEQVVRASADEALTDQINLALSQIGTTTAALQTESITRASETSALSAQYSTLSTKVGDNTASLSTLATSVDGVKVQYGVTGTIDNITGGFLFTGIKKLDGTVSFTLQIRGDVIVDGTIGAGKLNVIELSAISANLGTATAGRLVSPNGLVDFDLTNATLLVGQ